MAQDILAIPTSSVASESSFSKCRRVITDTRSSLQSESVETLMCVKDWLPDIRDGTGPTGMFSIHYVLTLHLYFWSIFIILILFLLFNFVIDQSEDIAEDDLSYGEWDMEF